jgi:hypothetical protein
MKASALTIFEFDLLRRSVDRFWEREGKKSKYYTFKELGDFLKSRMKRLTLQTCSIFLAKVMHMVLTLKVFLLGRIIPILSFAGRSFWGCYYPDIRTSLRIWATLCDIYHDSRIQI